MTRSTSKEIYTWRIELDQFGDEMRAKSGRVFSVADTCELLVYNYNKQIHKPTVLEVVTIGLGAALADMLEHKKIPVKRVTGLMSRIGGADVLKYKVRA